MSHSRARGNRARPGHEMRDPSGAAIAVQALVVLADPALTGRVQERLLAAMPVVVRTAADAPEAAAALHEANFDVVIADVDVPGFDDPFLLRLVRDTQPSAVRFGVLGRERADDPALAFVAHQVLRPEEVGDIGQRVRRTVCVHRAVEDPVVRAQIADCDVLPAVPELMARLSLVLGDADVGMSEVADVIGQDPELAARVLQLTNSAFLGRRQPTADLATAIAWLGTPAVRGLVVHMEVLRAFGAGVPQIVADLAAEQAAHGRDVANWARQLLPNEPEAWTAGLLHDLGKLVLAANDPTGWAAVLQNQEQGRSSVAAEQAVLGTNHAAVGAALLASWGLPPEVVEGVANHHQPVESGRELHVAGAVHLADAIVNGDKSLVDERWVEDADQTRAFRMWWAAAHP